MRKELSELSDVVAECLAAEHDCLHVVHQDRLYDVGVEHCLVRCFKEKGICFFFDSEEESDAKNAVFVFHDDRVAVMTEHDVCLVVIRIISAFHHCLEHAEHCQAWSAFSCLFHD